MGALVALISSYFGNNCESESAVFGLFFFTWMQEIRSCNIAKDDLSFRSKLGYSRSMRQCTCYPHAATPQTGPLVAL